MRARLHKITLIDRGARKARVKNLRSRPVKSTAKLLERDKPDQVGETETPRQLVPEIPPRVENEKSHLNAQMVHARIHNHQKLSVEALKSQIQNPKSNIHHNTMVRKGNTGAIHTYRNTRDERCGPRERLQGIPMERDGRRQLFTRGAEITQPKSQLSQPYTRRNSIEALQCC